MLYCGAMKLGPIALAMGLLGLVPGILAQDTPSTSEWGTKYNNPGAVLVAKETGRSLLNGQTVVAYTLFASGLPKNLDYVFWSWMAGRPPQPMSDAFLNDNGKIICRREDIQKHISEDPINLKLLGGKGELKRFALISTDDQYRAFIDIVPFPFERQSGSCHISVETMVPDYSVVILRANGFLPNEHLIIDTKSGDEGRRLTSDASQQGTYTSVMMPLVKGKRSGKARFDITSSSCKVGIEFPWGRGAY